MCTLTEDFLRRQGFYFRLLGFDIIAGKQGWQRPWRTFWSLITLAIVQPMILVFSLQNVENVDRLTDGVGSLLVNLLALAKFGFVIWLHKDFEGLIQRIRQLLSKQFSEKIPALIISEENRQEQRVSGLYANSFLLTGALSCLMPLVTSAMVYWKTGQVQLQLTFPCVYPWDNRQLYELLFSYGLLISASFGSVLSTICVDTLFAALTHNLVALFKTAQHKMSEFYPWENRRQLEEILQLYQHSLDMSDALSRHFRLIICVQLVVASLLLCMLSYTLAENYAEPQMPFYAVFTLTVLIQLYIYCHCGEYLKTQSRKFSRAIYDCKWYEGDADVGRCLQFSMMRAQRGSRIDGYFFEPSMELFLSIVKTAMSYLALLRSIS